MCMCSSRWWWVDAVNVVLNKHRCAGIANDEYYFLRHTPRHAPEGNLVFFIVHDLDGQCGCWTVSMHGTNEGTDRGGRHLWPRLVQKIAEGKPSYLGVKLESKSDDKNTKRGKECSYHMFPGLDAFLHNFSTHGRRGSKRLPAADILLNDNHINSTRFPSGRCLGEWRKSEIIMVWNPAQLFRSSTKLHPKLHPAVINEKNTHKFLSPDSTVCGNSVGSLLRGTIANRTKYCEQKWLHI